MKFHLADNKGHRIIDSTIDLCFPYYFADKHKNTNMPLFSSILIQIRFAHKFMPIVHTFIWPTFILPIYIPTHIDYENMYPQHQHQRFAWGTTSNWFPPAVFNRRLLIIIITDRERPLGAAISSQTEVHNIMHSKQYDVAHAKPNSGSWLCELVNILSRIELNARAQCERGVVGEWAGKWLWWWR